MGLTLREAFYYTALLELDEQASFLGEVALVEKTSPVAAAGMLFHDILYDENAASHIAIGAGFPSLVEGLEHAEKNELLSAGLNQSIQHQDMMIGNSSMRVEGTRPDGTTVILMEDGLFTGE